MRNVHGAKVLVVGMARSGLATAELLLRHGASVRATDLNPAAAEAVAALGIPFAPQDKESFQGYDLIVVSPGVPPSIGPLAEARRRGVPVIGDVEAAGWWLRGPVMGFTGSNGKTTTTALAAHILAGCQIPCLLGGNIGTPVAAMVGASRQDQWNVLELSSFQLEMLVSFRVHVGAGLNVTPDHLDRHGTFEAYRGAKARLFELQQEGDFAVLNAGDEHCRWFATRTPARPVWFDSTGAPPGGQGWWLDGDRILCDGQLLMRAGDVPLRGRHNLENVMAAAAAARLAGAPLHGIATAVGRFPGVEHRLEFVRTLRGASYYNDSKATNVDATLKALDAFEGGLWVILGGKDKNSDYAPLREPLRKKARAALLIGAAAAKIEPQIAGAAPLVHCETLARAVDYAAAHAAPGDTVLLAPACASFDQFDNYEHRGRVFKHLVCELAGDSDHGADR